MSIFKLPDSPYLRPFSAGDDNDLLRGWVNQLYKHELANPNRLESEMLEWLEDEKYPVTLKFSRNTLKRFMDKEEKTYRAVPQMMAFWNFLASRKVYRQHFPKPELLKAKPMPEFNSSAELLAYAAAAYFPEKCGIRQGLSLERMQEMICGKFVMYRPDLEPAVEMEAKEQIRVSVIEISLLPHSGLAIKETQDFKKPKYFQLNQGILIPHGPYMLAFMKCEDGMSFKLMVIEEFTPTLHGEPIPQFKGKILVASDRKSFPSVHFVCNRMESDIQFGRLPYDVAPANVRKYLRTPTLESGYVTVIP